MNKYKILNNIKSIDSLEEERLILDSIISECNFNNKEEIDNVINECYNIMKEYNCNINKNEIIEIFNSYKEFLNV